jgi:predicted HD phosphohydrolase
MKIVIILSSLLLAVVSSGAGASKGAEDMAAAALVLVEQIQAVHPMWLRERCREAFYVDMDTRQPKYNIHEVEMDLVVEEVRYDESEDSFVVSFSDKNECRFQASTLQAELGNEVTFLQTDDWGFPPLYIWDKTLGSPPTFEHDEIIDNSIMTQKFLSSVISTGIVVISGVPVAEGECARFGSRFSSLRETEWGVNFNVRSTPDEAGGTTKKDLAYSASAIGMHVDSPYRIDTPPAYQLLHAMEHCEGPDCYVHNQFVDGFAVADALCEIDPDYFDILTKVMLRWENNGGDDTSFLYRYAPIIEVDLAPMTDDRKCAPVRSINFSAKSGGYAPNLPWEQADLFYEAKRKFSELLHSLDYTIQVQLYPGALVLFDNRRVLHSRSQILDTDGDRWLQGCYLNREGFHYLYEKLRRKYSNISATPFRSLREAQKSDYDRMGDEYDEAVAEKTIENLIAILESQKDSFLGARVSLYEHNLQTASRAWRAAEDEETVVMSLFHDMFETLAVKNHGDLVAVMLAPWISPKSHWILSHHEIFQGHYYFEYYGKDKDLRDMYKDKPYYDATVYWCEHYDQASFDPDYPSLPLSHFMPMVKRIFERQQYWWEPDHPKAGAVTKSQT